MWGVHGGIPAVQYKYHQTCGCAAAGKYPGTGETGEEEEEYRASHSPASRRMAQSPFEIAPNMVINGCDDETLVLWVQATSGECIEAAVCLSTILMGSQSDTPFNSELTRFEGP